MSYTSENAIKDLLKSYYLAQVPDYESLEAWRIKKIEKALGITLTSTPHKHQFITVALPTESTDLENLKRIIEDLEYAYLEDAHLTVEYYSGDKNKNLHIHILKHDIYSKTKIIRDMGRKFKVEPNFVNVKRGTKEKDYQNRLSYLKGDKLSDQKKANSIADIIWRDQNGFQQIYNL